MVDKKASLLESLEKRDFRAIINNFDNFVFCISDDPELKDSFFTNPDYNLYQKFIEKFKENPSLENLFSRLLSPIITLAERKVPKAMDLLYELTILALESGDLSDLEYFLEDPLLGGYEPGRGRALSHPEDSGALQW